MTERDKTGRGVIAWFTRNPVAANLLLVAIVVLGLFSAATIRKEIFPQIEQEVLQITVPYPGATPREVESGILLKLEAAVRDIIGVERIEAVAGEGRASVTLELAEDADFDRVKERVERKVDGIRSLPELAETPEIFRPERTSTVIRLQLTGPLSEQAMKLLAMEIRDELLLLPDIASASLQGARKWEIRIEIAEDALRAYGLTFDQVARRLRLSSLDLAGGTIKSARGEILLRTAGEASSGAEFASRVLRIRSDGSQLRLSDIATVTDGFEERDSYSRFDGQRSIGILVQSDSDANDLAIVQQVKQYMAQKQASLPPGVALSSWADRTRYLEGRLNLMLDNMRYGAVLVFMLLALFLNLRLAFWVIIGLPVSFLGAMAVMPLEGLDLSINVISLFGFILVLGIVVDDAIVIGESSYDEICRSGPGANSVIRGAQRVAMPATFGVLTTIAAFVPMIMVSGPMGTLWRSIGLVVILSLIFSLIESKWILPAHLVYIRRPDTHSRRGRVRARLDRGLQRLITAGYQPLLDQVLTWRYASLVLFSGLLLVALATVQSGVVRYVFFPDIPSDTVRLQLQMVDGTPSRRTTQTLDQLQLALQRAEAELIADGSLPVVRHVYGVAQSEQQGRIVVELAQSESREIDAPEIIKLWREQIPVLSGVKSLNFSGSTRRGSAGDLSFQLQGRDLDQLLAAKDSLRAQLAAYEGVADIEDSYAGGKPELKLQLRPQAESLGVTLSDLARQIRQGFYGEEIQRVTRGSEDLKVMLRYPLSQRSSREALLTTRIRNASGVELPFSEVAEIIEQPGVSEIRRVDGQLTISVSAAVDKQRAEPSRIVSELRSSFAELLALNYPGVSLELGGASRDESEALLSFARGFVVTLLAIYALMAIPLKSYLQPLIIMSVIPFGIIGAIGGHLLIGIPLSVLSLTGIIALAGVVVNDSLILVNRINQERQQQADGIREAVERAAAARFRAIILTSLTTFAGLIPILSETSLQARIVIPMAVSLAFGILFATVITLLLVPVLYLIMADLRLILHRLLALYRRQTGEAEYGAGNGGGVEREGVLSAGPADNPPAAVASPDRQRTENL